MKQCTKCGEHKELSEFFKKEGSKDGLTYQCKKCTSDRHRQNWLLRSYGISEPDYKSLLESQGGVCKICGKECSTGRNLAVDHCHKTGKVRGLLCKKCNVSIGAFGDDIEVMSKAIEYLKQHALGG